MERSQRWSVDDGQISKPIASIVWFDLLTTLHRDVAELAEIDRLVVNATDETVGLDYKLHEDLLLCRAEDTTARTIDEQTIQHGLHGGKFRGHTAA